MAGKKSKEKENVVQPTVEDKSVDITQQSDVKVKSKLVGCDIVLDPVMSGMFVDSTNNITLGFIDKQSDSCTITEVMDLTVIKRNIAKGILRVYKNGKDITGDIGGPVHNVDWKMQPIILNAHKPLNDSDTPLIAILNRNNQSEIIKTLKTIKNYKTLHRLKDLEEMGKNPASQPRADVIDALTGELKMVFGISEAQIIEEDSKDIIQLK